MKRHDDEIILILILLVLTFKIKSQIISRIKFFRPSHFMRAKQRKQKNQDHENLESFQRRHALLKKVQQNLKISGLIFTP